MNPYESPSPLPTGDPLHRNSSGRLVSPSHTTRRRRKSFDYELILLTGFIAFSIVYILLTVAITAVGASI
jgi:hypothetical protein